MRKCPGCGYVSDSDSYIGGPDEKPKRPNVGDLSVCIACGDVALYQRDFVGQLELRAPTPDERRDLELDDLVRRARAGIGQARAEHSHSWPTGPKRR